MSGAERIDLTNYFSDQEKGRLRAMAEYKGCSVEAYISAAALMILEQNEHDDARKMGKP